METQNYIKAKWQLPKFVRIVFRFICNERTFAELKNKAEVVVGKLTHFNPGLAGRPP